MKFGIRHVLALSIGSAAVIAACSHGKPSTTTTTAASAPRFSGVVEKLATARCNHEVTCNEIGASKKYPTREACLADMKALGANDFNSQCPGAVDQRQVEKCIADLRTERCGNPIDMAARINDCRLSELCPHSSSNTP